MRKFQTAIEELIWINTRIQLDIAFATSILNKYISNLSLKHFQALKKLYKYFLRAKLTFKYTGIPGAHIILGILLDNNIYLNTYNNLD